MTDLSFAISAITEIVHILATESGTIVERLLRTAEPLAELDADRVPEQIRDEYQQILEDIRKPPADAAADEPEASLAGCIAQMEADDASEIAERLVSFYVCFRSFLQQSRANDPLPPV